MVVQEGGDFVCLTALNFAGDMQQSFFKKSAVRHFFSLAFSFNFISCDCAKGCYVKHFLPLAGDHCCDGKICQGDMRNEGV